MFLTHQGISALLHALMVLALCMCRWCRANAKALKATDLQKQKMINNINKQHNHARSCSPKAWSCCPSLDAHQSAQGLKQDPEWQVIHEAMKALGSFTQPPGCTVILPHVTVSLLTPAHFSSSQRVEAFSAGMLSGLSAKDTAFLENT